MECVRRRGRRRINIMSKRRRRSRKWRIKGGQKREEKKTIMGG